MGTKFCTGCQAARPLRAFNTRIVNGRRYPHSQCRRCKHKKERSTEAYRKKASRQDSLRHKRWRARHNAGNREFVIVKDTRGSDKKKGYINDLDHAFVRALISNGCSYCGAPSAEEKMTLDRIDNSIGHTKSNVVVACWSCNGTRGDMPYAAWLVIAPVVRKARELGLLKGWTRNGL